jgi:hypothetical protein
MARRAGPRAPPPARPSRGDGSGPRRATFGEFSGPNLLRPVRGLWAPHRAHGAQAPSPDISAAEGTEAVRAFFRPSKS